MCLVRVWGGARELAQYRGSAGRTGLSGGEGFVGGVIPAERVYLASPRADDVGRAASWRRLPVDRHRKRLEPLASCATAREVTSVLAAPRVESRVCG